MEECLICNSSGLVLTLEKIVNLQDTKINILEKYNLHGDTEHILIHLNYTEWLHPDKKGSELGSCRPRISPHWYFFQRKLEECPQIPNKGKCNSRMLKLKAFSNMREFRSYMSLFGKYTGRLIQWQDKFIKHTHTPLEWRSYGQKIQMKVKFTYRNVNSTTANILIAEESTLSF